ncbi:ArsB/NhaD family transporter [Nocardia higoensis]|uniref:ArsB/NhaD family transporter n=1 Tax=Nocardia higoensis TaxID=228599 RepID=A0ABS0DCG5_9NOCA|nr:ArsB/NhaD family transporter [Nocardia higoensis]MBF6356126.1 ArsB/NhaD family transporter [Nocardia higoensis]
MNQVLAVIIFVVAFGCIATERFDKIKVVLSAAGLMAVLGQIPSEAVFFDPHIGIDWNVIFLLLGMMVIVGVVKQTGLFDYLAIWAARRSRGDPFRLMVMLMTITAIASPILDNVTIILLVAPITIVVCDQLGLPAQPFLIAEVLAANIGGAATLVGDPPNIIIGSRAGLSFNDFLIHMAPAVAVIFALFVMFTRVLFRGQLSTPACRAAATLTLDERAAITDPALLWRSLTVLTGVVIGFALHTVVGIAPSIVALVGAGVMVLVADLDIDEILREVEWGTLVFFMGLFVMVAGLIHTGVVDRLASAAVAVVGDSPLAASAALVFGSAAVGSFIDNIPYTTTIAPVVEELVEQTPDHQTGRALWWSFAFGAGFSGNGTAVAAGANVVALGIARRAGHPITFWQFTRYGVVVTVASTALAFGYLWARYF